MVVSVASPEEAQKGRIESIRVQAQRGVLGDFQFQSKRIAATDLDFELQGVQLDATALLASNQLRIFGFQGVRVHGLTIREGVVRLQGELTKGPSLSVGVRLWLQAGRELRFRFVEARFGWLVFPTTVLNRLLDPYSPLLASDNPPLEIDLGRMELDHGAIRFTASQR